MVLCSVNQWGHYGLRLLLIFHDDLNNSDLLFCWVFVFLVPSNEVHVYQFCLVPNESISLCTAHPIAPQAACSSLINVQTKNRSPCSSLKPTGDFSGRMWYLQLAPLLGKGWWRGLTLQHTHSSRVDGAMEQVFLTCLSLRSQQNKNILCRVGGNINLCSLLLRILDASLFCVSRCLSVIFVCCYGLHWLGQLRRDHMVLCYVNSIFDHVKCKFSTLTKQK